MATPSMTGEPGSVVSSCLSGKDINILLKKSYSVLAIIIMHAHFREKKDALFQGCNNYQVLHTVM